RGWASEILRVGLECTITIPKQKADFSEIHEDLSSAGNYVRITVAVKIPNKQLPGASGRIIYVRLECPITVSQKNGDGRVVRNNKIGLAVGIDIAGCYPVRVI